jgi:diguanylate cyclase (GGDEF)-like protein
MLAVGEKIRADLEAMIVMTAEGEPTKSTVSIGANIIVPERDSSPDIFISQADTALYSAKQTGRNRVFLYEG